MARIPIRARHDCDEPVLKAFVHQGKRTSLRLEKSIWDSISYLSRSQSRPLRHYVEEALCDCDRREGRNRSAFLRARVAAELLEKAMDDRLGLSDLSSIVRASPTPAFALSAAGELRDYNDEMAQFIRHSFDNRPAAGAARLELSFARPLSVIDREIDAARGAALVSNFSLRYADTVISGRARLTAIGPLNTPMRRLVGFVAV